MYSSGLVFEAQGAVPEAAAWDDSAIMKASWRVCVRWMGWGGSVQGGRGLTTQLINPPARYGGNNRRSTRP